MFSRNRDDTTRAEPRRGIIPSVHSVLAVRLPDGARQDFFKGTSSQPIGRRRGINISGVDFWHAVEFSRNGRFLCTHPLGLSSGRFPSVLLSCFVLAFPTLSDRFPVRFPRCFPAPFGAFRRVHYFSGFPGELLIGPSGPSRIGITACRNPSRKETVQ